MTRHIFSKSRTRAINFPFSDLNNTKIADLVTTFLALEAGQIVNAQIA